MPKNVYRPFSVTVCRDCTEKAIASAEGEPPCILAERAMRARSRTQVRFPYLGQVGNPCPAAMSWKDLRHLLQDKRAVYDTDAYGTTVLDSIRRNIPKHQFGGSDPDSEWAASQAYIAPHGKNWKTTLGDPHVPIAVYPGDAWWENWRRNIYYKQVTLDPFTTWLGFTAKAQGGAGAGAGKGVELSIGSAYNMGQSALAGTGARRVLSFTAEITRKQTYGGDIGAGLTAVLIFGLDKAENLKGVKFGGEDINIQVGAAIGKLAKLPDYWKLIKLINALREGSRLSANAFEFGLTITKGVFWGGSAVASRGSDVIMTLIDLPFSFGVGVSYIVYDGVVTSAAPA